MVAFGAATLVVSTAALLTSRAPSTEAVAASRPGTPVAHELRVAELMTGATVILAGGVAGVVIGQWWPVLMAVAGVGAAMAVYEGALYFRS